MGWDWWTLRLQPKPFVDVIRDMIKEQNKHG